MPPTITIKMRDLVPYKHAVLALFDGRSQPSVIEVVSLRWCDDGRRMSAMLESHNFIVEEPDTLLDYVVEAPAIGEFYRERVANWVAPVRPVKHHCPTCGHEVKP